jgi:hypothetical protein
LLRLARFGTFSDVGILPAADEIASAAATVQLLLSARRAPDEYLLNLWLDAGAGRS